MVRYFLCLFLLLPLGLLAQCDAYWLPTSSIQVLGVTSENGNQPISLAFDGDSATHFRTNGNTPFPHEVWLDLGDSRVVNGLYMLPRQTANVGRLGKYELYVSEDTLNWGAPQAADWLIYENNEDYEGRTLAMGGVKGRYMRIVGLSNEDAGNIHRWMVAEFGVSTDTCGTTITRQNQVITFDDFAKQRTDEGPITLDALASSGLPVSFEVVSGPATVNANELTFTGAEGTVVIKAIQEGDANWYPATYHQSIEAIEPANHPPVIITRLTDSVPLEMPYLNAYPIMARTEINHSDLFEVDSMVFQVNGKTFEPNREGDYFQIWWQPDSFGPQDIQMTAYGSHGIDHTENISLEIKGPTGSHDATIFDHDVIQFGGTNSRWLYKTVTLPQFLGSVTTIEADFWTECPNVSGGCDDWDRLAWIDIQAPDGSWVELIRYITPYGVGCNHEIDLSDYGSLLQGEVTFRMFIDTWGTGGWDVNLNLDYRLGIPEHLYSQVDVLWKGAYPFGDMARYQPVDTLSLAFNPQALTSKLHLVSTGHGWGSNNWQNAAEFYHAIHHLYVDDSATFVQDLWADCNPNPDGCQPQAGTWQFNRAGWCPGAIANRYEYDFTPLLAREQLSLAYIFDQGYTDFCHPNNPNCVTGQTCSDCNAGYNPFFQVSGNLITYFDSVAPDEPRVVTAIREVSTPQLGFSLQPNPAQHSFQIRTLGMKGGTEISIRNMAGQEVVSQRFLSVENMEATEYSVKDWPTGVYLVQIQSAGRLFQQKLVVQ